jgi:hypothetical protein
MVILFKNNGNTRSVGSYGSLLTYLGVIPFWLCAIAIALGVERDYAILALRSYGAVIASFISGIHWGIAMQNNNRKTLWLLFFSNVVALMAWALLLYSAISAFIKLSFVFIVLITIDTILFRSHLIDSWFIKLRWRATILVLIALVSCALYQIEKKPAAAILGLAQTQNSISES